jgi:hypothetical protein
VIELLVLKSKVEVRLAYLERIITDPMSEPGTSEYRYEHRVQASELRGVLKMIEEVERK